MFMVDDVLLLPVRGLFYVLREIREAAAEEVRRQEEAVRRELSELYMALERREITEEQFGAAGGGAPRSPRRWKLPGYRDRAKFPAGEATGRG